MKLFCVSGHVANPDCFELPLGMKLGEIIEGPCGGMRPGSAFKSCLPGGASTPYFTNEHWDVQMDFDPVAKAGSRLGTGGIVVFDQRTCMVAVTLNLVRFYARESCGWCTPCREGLPFVVNILETIESGQGSEEHIAILREHVQYLNYAFCALAPGAMGPVDGLLRHFEGEIREHNRTGKCPCRN
jgi:NADH-quinone oxidoreductase subunit F